MSMSLSLQDQTTEFLLYTAPNGEIKVEVRTLLPIGRQLGKRFNEVEA